MPPSAPLISAPGAQDIERISCLAHQHFGLDLRNGVGSDLVSARLGRLVAELGFTSFHQYCGYLEADRTGTALAALADRLTTNHTSFFREPEHLRFLRSTVLPGLRRRPLIEIWSAGCSSGEEPYSIAMSLIDELPVAVQRARIHATDLSTRMLARAAEGAYSADRIRPVPQPIAERCLMPPAAGSSGPWRVTHEVRSMVEFHRVNLIDPAAPCRFPIIFCRNVMLYLHNAAHQALLDRLCSQLEDGGHLFIGHADSLRGVGHNLELVFPAVYRKPGRMRASHPASATERPPCWP